MLCISILRVCADTMFAVGSPKAVALSKVAQKKNSPKPRAKKNRGGSSKERASWNPDLEKTLVELLHEHNVPQYRGNNGWSSEAWSKIVSEFHAKHTYVTMDKNQIQEKEKELKRDYKMLKEARMQSGASWNEKRCMIEAEPHLWNNIITTFPRANKFRKKPFPLFDALGELYDGQYAEGTWNFTSTQPPQYPVLNKVIEGDQLSSSGVEFPDLEESYAYQAQHEAGDARQKTTQDVVPQTTEDTSVEKNGQRPPRKAGAASNQEKEPKKVKKGAALEGALERYIDVRIQQVQGEADILAREKELVQANDYSIKRCISILMKTTWPPNEKVKASEVFQIPANRETFISFNEDDPELGLLWLRGKVDKL
ncbi:hypothetical protein QYE76_009563 [Lolium multiflorum]|uniref:Myb/SANT-like domain-containing protein n=1 Tax=Lolium multiflorum TaxID=4521 RepID=A0AAD8X1C7_LOLMU|nr:hypothetical protein QYE76_009563 [Lolium multiflorum]